MELLIHKDLQVRPETIHVSLFSYQKFRHNFVTQLYRMV